MTEVIPLYNPVTVCICTACADDPPQPYVSMGVAVPVDPGSACDICHSAPATTVAWWLQWIGDAACDVDPE